MKPDVAYDTAEYPPLIKASTGHRWRGQDATGKPIVRESDGTVCLPLSRYFGISLLNNRVDISSMQGEAYILREWWAYLASIGCHWEDANDQVLLDWRSHLKHLDVAETKSVDSKRKAEDAHNNRVRKLEVVFAFYLNAETRVTKTAENEAVETGYKISKRRFVSPKGPVTSTWAIPKRRGRGGVARRAVAERELSVTDVVWAYAEPRRTKMTRRPTPDDDAIAKVTTALRSRLVECEELAPDSGPRRRGRPPNKDLPERDYLIGKIGTDAGLRVAEIASFSMKRLSLGLEGDGIEIPSIADLGDVEPDMPEVRLSPLDALAYSAKGRKQVIDALEYRKRRHYQYVWVEVTGKGKKTRSVPVPITDVIEILNFGVWQLRKKEIAAAIVRHEQRRKQRRSRGLSPGPKLAAVADQLFLSAGSNLKDGLKAATISKLLKAAFKAAGVVGTAHALRHYFATKTCARLWAEAFALNGFRWDQTVETFVLEQLAQALGHSTVEVSVRTYLDKELMRSMGLKDKTALGRMRKVASVIAENHMALSKADFDRLIRIIPNLSARDAQADEFTAVLDAWLAEQPDRSATSAHQDSALLRPLAGQRHLRLIAPADIN